MLIIILKTHIYNWNCDKMQLIFGKKWPGFEPSPFQTRKKQKKNTGMLWDLNPGPLDLKAKMLPLSYQDSYRNWFLLSFLVPHIFVLADFSQLLPISAKFHLCSIKVYLFSQLFSLYDMSEPGWDIFQNQPLDQLKKKLWLANIFF